MFTTPSTIVIFFFTQETAALTNANSRYLLGGLNRPGHGPGLKEESGVKLMKKRNPHADVYGARLRKRGIKKTRDYEIRMMKAGEQNNYVERSMKRGDIGTYGLKLRKREVGEPYGVRIMKRNSPKSRILYSLPGKVERWGKREILPDGVDFGKIMYAPMGKTTYKIMKSGKITKKNNRDDINMAKRSYDGIRMMKRDYDGIRMMKRELPGPIGLKNYWS